MEAYKTKRYIILKKYSKYGFLDTNCYQFDEDFEYLSLRKNRHLILHRSITVIDDWYADIGTITHTEKEAVDLGLLFYESDNEQEAKHKYYQLSGETL